MKHKMALVVVLAFLGAACGPGVSTDSSPAISPAASGPVPVAESPPALDPGLRNASPEPITEPVFKPAPEPSAAPLPKPVRSNPPTPPPTRRRPPDVASHPTTPRVPPSLDAVPGSSVGHDEPRVAAALSSLATRLNLDSSAIDVLDAREVTWRDGSVGCPSAGLAYSQAEVPGFLVVLRSGESSYRYHSAGSLMPFLCETPQSPVEGSA